MMPRHATEFLSVDWGRLAYTSQGTGPRTVVLLHQLMLDKRAQWPIADSLEAGGYRVICLDLPGHGESDAPRDAEAYGLHRTSAAVAQAIEALTGGPVLLGGASLGAAHAMRVALEEPEMVAGLWAEMPIVDRGIRNAAYWGGFALTGYSLASPLLRLLARADRGGPRGSGPAAVAGSILTRDPIATRRMLIGLLSDGIRPWLEDWRSITAPTLVTGHPWDFVHVRSDARMMADQLPTASYLESPSIVSLRRHPERGMPPVIDFANDVFEHADDARTLV